MNLVLAEGVVKASLLLATALAAMPLLRRRSAAVRHCVLATAIVCTAAMPALQLVAPSWRLPLSASSWLGSHGLDAAGAPRRTTVSSRAAAVVDGAPTDAADAGARRRSFANLRALLVWATAMLPRHAVEAMRDVAARASTSAARGARLLPAIWLAGVAILLLRLIVSLARLWRIAAAAHPVRDAGRLRQAQSLADALGVRRAVRLLHSDHPTLLVTWGSFRPVVLLPAPALDWTPDRTHIVLAHELAHVARRDGTIQLVAEIVRAVYWLNPLLWMACRRLRHESELAADDVVLRLGVDRTSYAAHLLELARTLRPSRIVTWGPAPAMARASRFERRIAAMLNVQVNRAPLTRSARATAIAALVCASVPTAGVRLFAHAALPSASAAAASAQARDPRPPAPAKTATLSGTVRDPAGVGVPRVPVVLLPAPRGPLDDVAKPTSGTPSRPMEIVTTDDEGRFAFVDQEPDAYRLEARVPGYLTLRYPITLRAGEQTRYDVNLELGQLKEVVRVTNEQADRVSNDTTAVMRILDDQYRDAALRPPIKIRAVLPQYTGPLLVRHVQGIVKLEGVIATDGSVTDIDVIESADPELAKAATAAFAQWRFTPTRLHGSPVETRIATVFQFRVR